MHKPTGKPQSTKPEMIWEKDENGDRHLVERKKSLSKNKRGFYKVTKGE